MPSRTPGLIATALFASSLVLSACSESAETADTGSEPPATGRTLVISTDLALGGASAAEAEASNDLLSLYLEQRGNRAGPFPIELLTYDSSSGDDSWDPATCARNAQDHVTQEAEVAVIGAQDSGCSKVLVPVLNSYPDGPMLIVSPTNTDPGLTMSWAPREPEIYYPTGARNYVRIRASDPDQGRAAAQFVASQRGVKKCAVVHDDEVYGQRVARAFINEARDRDIRIVANEPWNPDARRYSDLFELISAADPDCLFVSGRFRNNGARLLTDKVKQLGPNKKLLTVVPARFGDDPDFAALGQAQGVYVVTAGLDLESLVAEGGVPADLNGAYEQAQGKPLPSSDPLYAVAAAQVVLDAIARSDGSRLSVTSTVLGENSPQIPATESAIGTPITIDPETGASNNRDMTISVITEGERQVITPWRVR